MGDTFARILRVVRAIPRGKVMTYGDVALAAGLPGAARVVGYALRACAPDVPWQRVLGRRDRQRAHITMSDARGKSEQRRLLECEGVRFDAQGAVSLVEYGHAPGEKSRGSGRVRSRA